MAKYKVLRKFRNLETQEVYKKDQEIELTVKRADEAIANLEKYNDVFLERIDNATSEEDAQAVAPEDNVEGPKEKEDPKKVEEGK